MSEFRGAAILVERLDVLGKHREKVMETTTEYPMALHKEGEEDLRVDTPEEKAAALKHGWQEDPIPSKEPFVTADRTWKAPAGYAAKKK